MTRPRHSLSATLFTTLVIAIRTASANELEDMLKRMLAHDVVAAPGYLARVVVPPGHTYDPLVMHVEHGRVWLNDDGKKECEKGSRGLPAITGPAFK